MELFSIPAPSCFNRFADVAASIRVNSCFRMEQDGGWSEIFMDKYGSEQYAKRSVAEKYFQWVKEKFESKSLDSMEASNFG